MYEYNQYATPASAQNPMVLTAGEPSHSLASGWVGLQHKRGQLKKKLISKDFNFCTSPAAAVADGRWKQGDRSKQQTQPGVFLMTPQGGGFRGPAGKFGLAGKSLLADSPQESSAGTSPDPRSNPK